MKQLLRWLGRWEALLFLILVVVIAINVSRSPNYLTVNNQINLFQLYIEKIIVALAMTLIIINGEIDLSVASVMGLAACVTAYLFDQGLPMPLAIGVALLTGVLCGLNNGFWSAYVGLPSLVVTLAGLIGYSGAARVLLEDKSITGFPQWFNDLGQKAFLGPLTLAIVLFLVLVVLAVIVLQSSGFGRYIYVIGNNAKVARYSGVKVKRVKMTLFILSGLISAMAGVLLAARLGAVRGNTAEGFELDIITMVLLGGVSSFGGTGTLVGVFLSILLVLNLRNGMSLVNITGETQTGIIGALLILSVLIPNIMRNVRNNWVRRLAT
ncbi:MAG: ABC transporter permease [Caldilineaceae bacterium]